MSQLCETSCSVMLPYLTWLPQKAGEPCGCSFERFSFFDITIGVVTTRQIQQNKSFCKLLFRSLLQISHQYIEKYFLR